MAKQGANQLSIKTDNKLLVLQTIQKKGPISRADLAEITGLTKAAITNITTDLLKENCIRETGSASTPLGRRPILLDINPGYCSILGLYLARDFYTVILTDFSGKILAKTTNRFDGPETQSMMLKAVTSATNKLLRNQSPPVLGMGITTIGPLDSIGGMILAPKDFHGWHDIPIVQILQDTFNIPVFLENDCNASILAEKLLGKFRDENNMVYLGVENGVGSGVIIDGKLYKGDEGYGVELGHTTVDINGPPCTCGNTGCLENYLKLPHIVKQVKIALELGASSSILQGDISWEIIIEAARLKDEVSLKAIDHILRYLTVAVVNAINIFDPSVVILGHNLVLAKDLILPKLKQTVKNFYLTRNYKQVRIECSSFLNHGPIFGAVALVLDKLYSGKIDFMLKKQP
ncbi:MAG TPA: ROK family protein [Clostridiales bacterium]|nr:ROK family protein [Clostridiales bacterium]